MDAAVNRSPVPVAPPRAPEFGLRAVPDTDSDVAEEGGSLLERLAKELRSRNVAYCQWKGSSHASRWSLGLGDIDLLVDHKSISAFRRIVGELGFKSALAPGARQIPGIESFFGHDPKVPRLLHLHVHYRLVVGDWYRTTYRIPIEREILDTVETGSVFPVPAPTYQLLIFVLRLVLQQRRLRFSSGPPLDDVRLQLENLEACSSGRAALATILSRHLPSVDLLFFDRCVRSLRGECSRMERLAVGHQLHRRLSAQARRPPLLALLTAAIEKASPAKARGMLVDARMRLAGGGTIIALIGGDGAGKSTCAAALGGWLGYDFPTMHAHLGRPPRSLLTLAVGGMLKAEGALNRLIHRRHAGPSNIELLRYVCTARDRHRLYHNVRRFSAAGGVVICERYPVPECFSLAGPTLPELLPVEVGAFGKLLQITEASNYERMLPPDALFVLRLEPELAVVRKPGEPSDYVRTRARLIWDIDWSGTRAQVVDASRTLPEVLTDLRALSWAAL